MKKQRLQGFTLIEIMVVVVIIAILATLGIFSFSSSRLRAANAKAVANLYEWDKVMTQYKLATGKYPMMADSTLPVSQDGWLYCLGDGFPSDAGGGSVPRCRLYKTTSGAQTKTEAASAAFMSELASKSIDLPKGIGIQTHNLAGTYIILVGNDDAPVGTWGGTDGTSFVSYQLYTALYGSTGSVCTDAGLIWSNFVSTNPSYPAYVTCYKNYPLT